MGSNSVNNNKPTTQLSVSGISIGSTRAQMKTAEQKSIFDKMDTNKDGKFDEKDSGVVSGKVKNKEGKLVEKQYIKLKDLPEGRTLVADERGKQWLRAKDGTILSSDYAKYNDKSDKVEVNKQKAKPQYNVSKEKLQTVNTLIKTGKQARADFDKQLAQDGWAGDVADGISVLWGSDNRASKVRDDFKTHNKNMAALKKAAEQGEQQFEQTFENIYGIKYNQSAIDNYKKNPTDENYEKAFGKKQKNITKRVADYNQSQQTGAAAVKTTAKVGAGIAVGVATGGTGLVALGAAAAGTAVASAAIEESDRMHITGQHKDSSGKTIKDKGTFREGTDHGKILKDAVIDGTAVLAGGAVGKAAQTVAKGRKFVQVGANVAGDVATGAVQEKIQTGEVTLSGTLMNAGMSGVGSAASTGLLKDGFKKIKKSFGNAADGVSKKFSTPKSQMSKTMYDKDGNILVGGMFDGKKEGGSWWSKIKEQFSDLTPQERQLQAANQAKNQKALDLGLQQNVDEKLSENIISTMNAKGSAYSTSDATTGYVVSDRLLQALEMKNNGKTLVKKLSQNVDINQISKHTKNGEICSLNGSLYINENGVAKQLKISPEKFEELFPPMKLAIMQQSGGTYICAATAQINGMLETPSGRAHLFSMLEQNGDDIIVNLNHSTVKFPGGKPVKMPGKFMENAPDGVQMIEQAFMTTNIKKAAEREITNIRELSVAKLGEQANERVNMRAPQDAVLHLGPHLGNERTVYFKTNTTKRNAKGVVEGSFKDDARAKLEQIMNEFVPGQDIMIAHWHGHQRTVVNYDPVNQIVTYRDPMSPGVDTQCTFVQFMNKGRDSYGLDVAFQKGTTRPALSPAPKPNAQSQKPRVEIDDGNRPVSQMKNEVPNTKTPVVTAKPQDTVYTPISSTFNSRTTELGRRPLVVARTAEGNPIGATVTNSNVVIIKDGKHTAIPIPEAGETIPIHETSTDTFLIVKNENGKVSITTSETPELSPTPRVKTSPTQQPNAQSQKLRVEIGTENRPVSQMKNEGPTTRTPDAPAKPKLAIPSGFKEYERKIMGKRAIINSDNVIMYESNGKWKRLN